MDFLSYDSIGNKLVAFLIRAEQHVNDCKSFSHMLKQHGQCFEVLNPLKYGIEPFTNAVGKRRTKKKTKA